MLVLLTAVFLIFHAVDLDLTLRATAMGKRERNPVARFLMRRMGRVVGLVALKLASVAGALFLIGQLPFDWQVGSLTLFSFLAFLVVMNNIGVLRRARDDASARSR
jgi:uncharacterized membrane protein